MNGNDFLKELNNQIKAVQALGNCCGSWATTYKMYDECEHKLNKFIYDNRVNIVLCLDFMDYNTMHTSSDDIFNSIHELYACGDYEGAGMNTQQAHKTAENRHRTPNKMYNKTDLIKHRHSGRSEDTSTH